MFDRAGEAEETRRTRTGRHGPQGAPSEPPGAPGAGTGAGTGAAHRPPFERTLAALSLLRAVNARASLDDIIGRAADAALDALEGERAFVVLEDPALGRRFEATRNVDREEVQSPEAKTSATVITRVITSGRSFLAEDAERGLMDGAATASMTRLKLRSILCSPVVVAGRPEGAIYVDNRFRRGAFGETDRRLLEALCDQVALAIERARLVDEAQAARARAEGEAQALLDACRSQKVEITRLLERLDAVAPPPPKGPSGPRFGIVGRSRALAKVLALVEKVAASDVPVLVTGESGTGKELLARAVHVASPRKLRPFVGESFAAIPESLAESELFGHMKGAFTGAHQDRAGLFERAHQGTLFLDEVGDMPLELQKKLLRVLQEGEVRRLGGAKPIPVDVRIVAATHRNLKERVSQGLFREDLFYRLAVVEARLPPLRERPEDIPLLVAHVIARESKEAGRKPPSISKDALRRLGRRPWPGNVRELENACRRLLALAGESIAERDIAALDAGHARDADAPGPGEAPRLSTLDQLEKEHIERVLVATGWRPTEAAKVLGVSYTTLWRKMRAMGLRARRGPEGERRESAIETR